MNSIRRLSLAAALAAAVFSPSARAVTISASVPMPPLNFGNVQFTETNPTFYNYVGNTPTVPLALDFSAQNFSQIQSLDAISITLSFYNLDTNLGGQDYNNITLALGGIDTGILLNGYGNAGDTFTFNAAPANGAAILSALNTNGGILSIGLFDATASPSNPFWFNGGTASLDLTDSTTPTPVPFTPADSLGLGLVAVGIIVARLRRKSAAVAAA